MNKYRIDVHEHLWHLWHWFSERNVARATGVRCIKKAPKKYPGNHQKSILFATLCFYVDFMSVLAHFGFLFRYLWASFGVLWAPFGHPLAHFLCPWVDFWCTWRSIFSFLVPPGVIPQILRYFRRKSDIQSYVCENCYWEPEKLKRALTHTDK